MLVATLAIIHLLLLFERGKAAPIFDCKPCPIGYGVEFPCTETRQTQCTACVTGHNFSSSLNYGPCFPVSSPSEVLCNVGGIEHEIQIPADETHDVECICVEGFERDPGSGVCRFKFPGTVVTHSSTQSSTTPAGSLATTSLLYSSMIVICAGVVGAVAVFIVRRKRKRSFDVKSTSKKTVITTPVSEDKSEMTFGNRSSLREGQA